MKTWLKTELHTHTIDDPSDGKRIVVHSAQQLIDKAEEQGFQVLSITNHNQLLFTSALEEYARERGIRGCRQPVSRNSQKLTRHSDCRTV